MTDTNARKDSFQRRCLKLGRLGELVIGGRVFDLDGSCFYHFVAARISRGVSEPGSHTGRSMVFQVGFTA